MKKLSEVVKAKVMKESKAGKKPAVSGMSKKVSAGKPCVLLLSVGRWLESCVFCYCLLGGGWKAMCFVTVCWRLDSHVFC